MIILGVVLAVLLLLALLRVGVIAEYSEDGIIADAAIGPVHIRLVPPPKKKAPKKQKKKKEPSPEKPGTLSMLKENLPAIRKALSRLKRKLVINQLTIYFLAAGADPAAAALQFGGVSAGYGVILPLLENSFKIKKRDLRAAVSFDAEEPYIYVKAKLSLAVWEAVYIGSGLVRSMMKSSNIRAKIRKAV